MIFKNQVLGCGPAGNGVIRCYMYNALNNTWTLFTTGGGQYISLSSVVCNKKFYFFHDTNPSTFDPATKSWATWPVVPLFSIYSSTVVYGYTILRFGGIDPNQKRKIFKYDTLNTNSWIKLNSTAPMPMYYPGCVVLPNGNILVAASFYLGYSSTFAVYNVQSDTWIYSADQTYFSPKINVISIRQRVFVISDFFVHEFNYNNNTFSLLPFQLLNNRDLQPGLLEVPSGMLRSFQNSCEGI